MRQRLQLLSAAFITPAPAATTFLQARVCRAAADRTTLAARRPYHHAPHVGSFPPAAAAAHYGWLSRQYSTAAEMISAPGRCDEQLLRANPDCAPRLLQSAAAQLAGAYCVP